MILLLFKKNRLAGNEKQRLSRVMARLIPMLLGYNRYLREFKEVIDLESKITFK